MSALFHSYLCGRIAAEWLILMHIASNAPLSRMKAYLSQGHLSQSLFLGGLLVLTYHLFVGPLLLIPTANIIKSILMQIFGTLLPGTAVYTLLYTRKQSFLGALFLAYAFGYAFNILSYFFFVPFVGQPLIPYYVVLMAAVSIYIIAKRGDKVSLSSPVWCDCLLGALFLVYLFLQTLAYSGANISPAVTGSAWYPTDLTYWLENAAALARQFPPTEPRAYVGSVYYYHYFSSIQLAFLNLATGIDIFTLAVPFYTLGKSLLFFGSFFVLFGSILQNQWIQMFAMLVICFCDGLDLMAGITYTSHTWTLPFGFDIGFAFGALFLHCFYLQYGNDRFDWRACLLSLLTFSICSGLKMPVAVIVIVAAGIVCFAWLFQKKYRLAFSYGMPLLAVFFLIAIGCAGLFLTGTNRTGDLMPMNYIYTSSFLRTIYEALSSIWPRPGKFLFLAIISCISMHPVIMALYALGGTAMLVDRDVRTARNLGLLLSGIFGLALGMCTTQDGQSEMYFTMSALIPCIILGLIWLETQWARWHPAAKRQTALLCGILLFFQISLMLFQSFTYWGNGLLTSLQRGCTNIFSQENAQGSFKDDLESLQKDDLEALAWIRDNTPKDSVVLTDRSVLLELPKYMFYGAFSERQMYLEGDTYFRQNFVPEREHMRDVIQQVFQNSESALQTAIDEGVDYIVQTKWITPDFAPAPGLAVPVYESGSIRVYEVTG